MMSSLPGTDTLTTASVWSPLRYTFVYESVNNDSLDVGSACGVNKYCLSRLSTSATVIAHVPYKRLLGIAPLTCCLISATSTAMRELKPVDEHLCSVFKLVETTEVKVNGSAKQFFIKPPLLQSRLILISPGKAFVFQD